MVTTNKPTNNSASVKEFLDVLKGILELGLTPRELRVKDVSAAFIKNDGPDTIPTTQPDFFDPDQAIQKDKNKKKIDEEEIFYSSG